MKRSVARLAYRDIVTIREVAGSIVVSLPKKVLDAARLQCRDRVYVDGKMGTITISLQSRPDNEQIDDNP